MEFGYLHPNQWPYASCLEVFPPRRLTDAGARCLIDGIRIGRTNDGLGVTLSISERTNRLPAQSVHHDTVFDYTTYDFHAATWHSKEATAPTEQGQIIARVREAATHAPVTPVMGHHVLALCTLWEHWHRTDLRPGCVHQNRESPAATPGPCAQTGFRFGSAWLVEDVPPDVAQAIHRHVHRIHAEWTLFDQVRNAQ